MTSRTKPPIKGVDQSDGASVLNENGRHEARRFSIPSYFWMWIVALLLCTSNLNGQEDIQKKGLDPKLVEALSTILKSISAGDESKGALLAIEQEQFDALSIALDFSPKGRRRFLIPRLQASNKATLEQSAIVKLLGSQERTAAFRKALESLAVDFERVAKWEESNQNRELGYQYRWQASGLRGILPSNHEPWEPTQALLVSKPVTKVLASHPLTLWPAGSYSMTTTTHFQIASQAGLKPTEELVELCEQTFAIWKQMFPEFWLTDQVVSPEYSSDKSDKFSVALFRDKAAYVKALKTQQRNIAVSTGYYDPNRKLAMFYWDGYKTANTVVHELTHQFFFESGISQRGFDTDQGAGFPFVEGIALYMESLSMRRCGGSMIVDVGGWDSQRFQSARYRRLREDFWIPWDSFHDTTGAQLRNEKDIAKWYSHAAGLTHFWMDGTFDMQNSFRRYLQSIYRSSPDVSLLTSLENEESLRKSYDRYLLSSPSEASRPYFLARSEAVLSQCKISVQDLLAWPFAFRKSKWLDVSFTEIDDSLFLEDPSKNNSPVTPSWNITRLSLESTKISDRTIPALALMSDLEDLDLSGCDISDKGLGALQGNKSIRVLWLSECPITDASLNTIQSMTGLVEVHLSASNITERGWEQLLKSRPSLKNKSTRQ